MSGRLVIAEGVYRVLGRDDGFWCRFHRIKGYHLAKEQKPKQAKEARQEALQIAERMLKRKENAGMRKELLLSGGVGLSKAGTTRSRFSTGTARGQSG